MPDRAATKLRHHPASDYLPGLLLRQLLEIEDDVEVLHTIVKYKDGSVDVYRSQSYNSDTCTASVALQDFAIRAIRSGGE